MLEISYWSWLILAGVLIILEITTPIYYFLWLGITAATVGLISWLFPGIDFYWQLLIYSGLSFFSIFIGRLYLKNDSDSLGVAQLNRRAEQYIGRIITLDDDIINGEAKTRIDGITWKVKGPDGQAGQKVEVVAIEQKSVLLVKAV